MGLEADDGRPETSLPLRRGVQTVDRAVVRERQAIPGDQGRARHLATDPAALGPRHPRQAVGDGGGRFRTSGAGIRTKAGVIRANAARYRRDAGCRRSPLHLSLDDRASRDGACGSGRRRRARGPVRQPRTLRCQEDQGRLGEEGRRRVQETHRQHHARTGHAGAYTRRRSEPRGTRVNEARPANLPDPRVRRLRPTHASGGRSYLCPRRRRLGVRVPAGRPGEQGHRRPFRRADPGRESGAGCVRHARLPADGRPGVPRDRGGGFDNTGIDEPFDVFGIKGSLPRKGNPYDNAVVESTDRLLKKELVYRNHYTTTEQGLVL